jgi:hypothetical protein
MFKVIKDYPESRHFSAAVDGILAMAHKIDAKTLTAIVDAMQRSFVTMTEIVADMMKKDKRSVSHPAIVALMDKRLAAVFSSVEISSKTGFLEEMEEKVSTTCLYKFLKDVVEYKFDLSLLATIRRAKMIRLIERLFLGKRNVSLDCLAAFVKLLLRLLVTQQTIDQGLLLSLTTFCYLSIHKYQKLRNLLDDDNEGIGLNVYDPHGDDPYACNGLHSTIIQEIQTLVKNDTVGTVKQIIERLTKRLPPTMEQLSTRVSAIYSNSLGLDAEVLDEGLGFSAAPREESEDEEVQESPHNHRAPRSSANRPDFHGRDERRNKPDRPFNQRGRPDLRFGRENRDENDEDYQDMTKKYFDRKRKEDSGPHFARSYKKPYSQAGSNHRGGFSQKRGGNNSRSFSRGNFRRGQSREHRGGFKHQR